MISFAIVKTLFSGKLVLLWALPFFAVAVTEAFLGQMIIALMVALIGAAPPTVAIILQGRKQSRERAEAQKELIGNQNIIAERVDGKLDRLSRAETGQAKAEGIIEGRDKAESVAATNKTAATTEAIATAKADSEKVTKMEIVSSDENPVTTRPARVPTENQES